MAKKPAILCELVKDKFVGGQRNFVDTFNWLVSFCSNLRGKNGVTVDMTDSAKPTIKLDGGDSDSDGVEVVVRVEYDEETHTFKQYKRKLSKFVQFTDDKETESTVFIATAIDV